MALPTGYQVASCAAGDLVNFSAAFTRAVGKKKPLAYFRYNHSSNPIGAPVREKLIFRDEIVGSHTIRQLSLSIEGHVVRAGLTMDSFVLPEHRNRGLFSIMAQHTTRLARAGGMEVILGFANRNSIHAYKKYVGHSEPGRLRCLVLDHCHPASRPRFHVDNHQLAEPVRQVVDRDCHRELFCCSIIKSMDYLKWRYIDSPESRYFVVSDYRHFACILKPYGDQLQLVDLFLTRHADVQAVLDSCLHLAAERKLCLSAWLSPDHRLYRAMQRLPHRLEPAPQHLHLACYRPELRGRVLKLDNWHFVMGDSDVF